MAGSSNEIATLSGDIYKQVKIEKIDPSGITISYSNSPSGYGISRLKFTALPEQIQKRYGYDPQKAVEFKLLEEKANIEMRQKLLDDEKLRAAYEEEQAKLWAEEVSRQNAQKLEKFKTVSKILSDYHKAHTYIGTDTGAAQNIFACGDMACDVWNMVITKGIEAKIMVGNVEKDINSIAEVNHAWVMAEVFPGKWLALETTGGYVVSPDHARYYHGYMFSNPKEFKDCFYGHARVRPELITVH